MTCARAVVACTFCWAWLNSLDRSTVATLLAIERSRRRVPSGIPEYIAGEPESSTPWGPASSWFIAARATAVVVGISRRTGTIPSFPVKLPSTKYARTIEVPAGVGVGVAAGFAVGVVVGASVGTSEGVPDGLSLGSSVGESEGVAEGSG